MRYFIGIVLALGFFLTGMVILGAGFEMLSSQSSGDDALAALVIGGLLSLIGILIFFAARGAHRKRKAGKKTDPTEAGATVMGMAMVSDTFDDVGFDD